MTTLSIREVREQLSNIVSAVSHGETVTITRRGKPVARLTPIISPDRPGFPDLQAFRAKQGKRALKAPTVADLRRLDRY